MIIMWSYNAIVKLTFYDENDMFSEKYDKVVQETQVRYVCYCKVNKQVEIFRSGSPVQKEKLFHRKLL